MAEEQTYFTLPQMVQALEEFAPISLAEKWDNVGLLIEPSKPRWSMLFIFNEQLVNAFLQSFIYFRIIKSALLVNDLTERVLDNAIAASVDLIISYHPPIFAPMKRISQR